MKNIKFILIIAFISFSIIGIAQQDLHFSQFYNSPVTYNPATSGIIDGDFRVFMNYRSQWSSITTSPYKSTGVSVDAPMMGDNDEGSFFGIGINIFNDIAGESSFKSTGYNLSVNYAIEIDKQKYFAFGIKGGYLQRSIDYSGLIWQNQFVVDQFDLSRPTGETSGEDQIAAIDLGAGVFYYNKVSNDFRFFGGIAAEHLNAPDVSLIGSTEKYLRKYIGHAGAEITKKNTNMSFKPNVVVMIQGGNRYIDAGMDLKFILKGGSRMTGYYKGVSVAGGLYYRYQDAIYLTSRFNYDEFGFGFSYDLTLSELSKEAGSTGALEFMFTYQPAFTERAKFNRLFN